DLAFGIETGPQLPTAAHALGIGKPAWLFNGIVSANVGSVHVDLNAGGVRYTARVPGASAWRNAWAGAASWPLGADWGAAVELSGDARRGVDHGHQALIALNYNASPHLVFDAGVARGLDRGGHDASLFAGATFLLADFHHR
ncbi:MAG TPA: hypothetical protein VFB32_06435, partial [Rudaea sp.]|nr:hypothetical protein [Rudaea sp.]